MALQFPGTALIWASWMRYKFCLLSGWSLGTTKWVMWWFGVFQPSLCPLLFLLPKSGSAVAEKENKKEPNVSIDKWNTIAGVSNPAPFQKWNLIWGSNCIVTWNLWQQILRLRISPYAVLYAAFSSWTMGWTMLQCRGSLSPAQVFRKQGLSTGCSATVQ